MTLIDLSRLDGLGVVGNFLSRRVMPCQRRIHSAYEYQGSQDSTRMHQDNLEKPEIQRRINELFNLADNSFVRSDNRMHVYKLCRPAPKVIVVFLQCSESIILLLLIACHTFVVD